MKELKRVNFDVRYFFPGSIFKRCKDAVLLSGISFQLIYHLIALLAVKPFNRNHDLRRDAKKARRTQGNFNPRDEEFHGAVSKCAD